MNSPGLPHRPSFILTIGLLISVAALTVDMSLPAVPFMVGALATTLPRGQQIVGVFMAGMARGQIPAGLVSDRVGRLPVLYAGKTLFAVVAAFARDIDTMLVARFAQGFGAGGALLGAAIYDGTRQNAVIIIAVTGLLTASVVLLRPLVVPAGIIHHPDEPARN